MTRYEPTIDVASLDAIDVHVHIEIDQHGHRSIPDELNEAASKYFKADGPRPDLDSVAEYYRERRTAAVVFTVDSTTNLDHTPISNDEIIDGCIRHSDILIPFASVDPNREDAVVEAKRLIERGVRGFKFHPTVQGFSPDDERFFPLYEVLQDAGMIALFHTGQTGIGAGMRGGYGFELALSNPMLLDSVAARFPDLQIIMAHPSVPWQDEALSVATHKHNTWIDLSGWSPKYFPVELVRYANRMLKNRVLFGSDFPLLTPDRWRDDAEKVELFRSDEIRAGIMRDNAARLLGLA
ncbi:MULTISPECIES: amidohydrolase family protein [unclassified Microbacterium]|uniref:amidohydrolase family protein n=1 Tax=unclassified Microbacterium TaxID=2609290 RepID=UPI00097F5720|nr:amidohydrolase family protein [Microbacterium sp. JB110]RCS60944.1 amidohydrolase [Microbacterium sp. JB110]SJM59328.1 PROBABLE ANTIBIOTIC-RESISTANCE PROTEIN [Frigoribacterium sp. JB110]